MISGVPIKYPYRPSPRWAFWSWIDIPSKVNKGYVYLRRLRVILTPWFGVYLHYIFEPDTDMDPHDHPWPFAAVILRGGYRERVYPYIHAVGTVDFGAIEKSWLRFSFHRFPLDWAHRIIDLMPGTISLVFVGKKRKTPWGFYTADGWVPYNEYNTVVEFMAEQAQREQEQREPDPWEC